MSGRVATAVLSIFLAAPAAPGVSQEAGAGAVIDRVLEAYGGAERLAAVDAIRLEGALAAPTRGGTGSFVRIVEGVDRIKVLLHYPTAVEIRILEGREGWMGPSPDALRRPSEVLLGAMVLQAARSFMPWTLHVLRDRLQIGLSEPGEIVLGGEVGPGLTLLVHVDPETYRVLRSESLVAVGPMRVPFATDYSDFRDVDGVLVPFREETHASGVHTASVRIMSVLLNPSDRDRRLPVG